ncbi:MAG: Rrf2 family transcriptional regulator [Gammaproteobacteria bacterium]|jgi:Rrf2 family nitric oxide-sensitive transcriptional repressor
MQVTRHTDYALRVLIYLAVREGERARIETIADGLEVSANHLRKVVNALTQAGLVRGVRGRSGGIQLALPTAEIRVGDVVRLMETTLAPVNCTTPACVLSPQCRLRDALGEGMRAFLAVLDGYTLADLAGVPATRRIVMGL